jgi:hypothetical protein
MTPDLEAQARELRDKLWYRPTSGPSADMLPILTEALRVAYDAGVRDGAVGCMNAISDRRSPTGEVES